MYMFRSLNSLFGSGIDGINRRYVLDKFHQHLFKGKARGISPVHQLIMESLMELNANQQSIEAIYFYCCALLIPWLEKEPYKQFEESLVLTRGVLSVHQALSFNGRMVSFRKSQGRSTWFQEIDFQGTPFLEKGISKKSWKRSQNSKVPQYD